MNADYKQKKVDFDDISHLKPSKDDEEDLVFENKFKKLSDKIRQIVIPCLT